MSLRTIAISDVKFPLKSRDELPPLLMALQYIFITPELNEKVFALLENKICGDKKSPAEKVRICDIYYCLALYAMDGGVIGIRLPWTLTTIV